MHGFIAVMLAAVFLLPTFAIGQSHAAPPSSLHLAALQGDVQAVRQHVRAGTDLNETDAYGSTPLILAITFDKPEVARVLIEGGADIELRNRVGATPLCSAAFFGRVAIVETLLDHGADRFARDNFGSSPFDAVSSPFSDVKPIFDDLQRALAPFGFKVDDEQLKIARPRIAKMLRPRPEDLTAVEYAPVVRDDWKVSTPAEQGLDPNLVAELYLEAATMPKLKSVLIVKNGCLVAERYFNDGSIDHKNRLCSVTKSYTSALTGIALEKGILKSVDQKMLDFFPEIADRITDPRKRDITIRHLLQMRAGYPWEETDPKYWEGGVLTGRYLPLIEDIPLVGDPGSQFNYSNLSSNWLGIILHRAAGMNLKSFAQESLLTPIGAEAGQWDTDVDGHNNGCGNLHLTSRDMARFGLLYLNGGKWGGRQIVPAAWVGDSLTDYSPDTWVTQERVDHKGAYFRDIGYGYQWWSSTVGQFRVDQAMGHGGQMIILLHDLDMVIVANSYPFFLQHDEEAWQHEKGAMNLIGKFIYLLSASTTGLNEATGGVARIAKPQSGVARIAKPQSGVMRIAKPASGDVSCEERSSDARSETHRWI